MITSVPFTAQSYTALLFLFFSGLFVFPGINNFLVFSFFFFLSMCFSPTCVNFLSTHSNPLSFPSVYTSWRKCSWIPLAYWNLDWLFPRPAAQLVPWDFPLPCSCFGSQFPLLYIFLLLGICLATTPPLLALLLQLFESEHPLVPFRVGKKKVFRLCWSENVLINRLIVYRILSWNWKAMFQGLLASRIAW